MERTSTTVNMNVLWGTGQQKVETNQKATYRIASKEHELSSGARADELNREIRARQNDACMEEHTSTNYTVAKCLHIRVKIK
jgi:hypothetical protein